MIPMEPNIPFIGLQQSFFPTTTSTLDPTHQPEHIKAVIDRKRKRLSHNIRCKFCKSEGAWMSEEERRNKVNCPTCGVSYYLKEQHVDKES